MDEKKNKYGLIKLVLLVLIMVAIVLFAIDNSENVELGLVFGNTQAPLTAIIISCFLLGFLIGLVMLLFNSIKHKKLLKSKNKETEHLENRLGYLNEKIDELTQESDN